MAELPENFRKSLEVAQAAQHREREVEAAAQKEREETERRVKSLVGELLVAAEYTASLAFSPGVNLEKEERITELYFPAPEATGWRAAFKKAAPSKVFICKGILLTQGKNFEGAAQGFPDVPAQTGLSLGEDGKLYRSYAHDMVSVVEPTDASLLIQPRGERRPELELAEHALSRLAQIAVAAQDKLS